MKRLTDDTKIVVLKRDNPFSEGTERFKRARAILTSNGRPYADARKKGADSWTLRQLQKKKLVRVA